MGHLHQGRMLLHSDPITLSYRAQPTLEHCLLVPMQAGPSLPLWHLPLSRAQEMQLRAPPRLPGPCVEAYRLMAGASIAGLLLMVAPGRQVEAGGRETDARASAGVTMGGDRASWQQ